MTSSRCDVQEMQDEAAKDVETRRSEQLAWDFIGEEQRKRAEESSPEQLRHGARSMSSEEAAQQSSSNSVAAFQEAANLMRAGLKVHLY
jgi:ketosteroid isomerase-like protein